MLSQLLVLGALHPYYLWDHTAAARLANPWLSYSLGMTNPTVGIAPFEPKNGIPLTG